jgi:hypothetical protein
VRQREDRLRGVLYTRFGFQNAGAVLRSEWLAVTGLLQPGTPGVQPVSHAAYRLPQRRQKKKCTGYRGDSARW